MLLENRSVIFTLFFFLFHPLFQLFYPLLSIIHTLGRSFVEIQKICHYILVHKPRADPKWYNFRKTKITRLVRLERVCAYVPWHIEITENTAFAVTIFETCKSEVGLTDPKTSWASP